MLYYHLNDRLLDKKQRKLTPQRDKALSRYKQTSDLIMEHTIQTAESKVRQAYNTSDIFNANTSRFGKDEREFYIENRDHYRLQRDKNLETINQMEQDYDFLSGHSETNSLSRKRSPNELSVGGKPGQEAPSGDRDRKSSYSGLSDRSRITRFLYPKEHLRNLSNQKSPLRRSNSVVFLRNLI